MAALPCDAYREFHYQIFKLAGGVDSIETTRNQTIMQHRKGRSCKVWYREEQKQQHIGETENILLKRHTTEGIRNNDQKSLGRLDSSASWNSSHSGRFLACVTYSPGICEYSKFQNLRNSMRRRYQASLTTSGCTFKHFLEHNFTILCFLSH